MPDYVPISDLTIVGSIGNNDLFPLSDGSGAYAVRGSTIKSYAATDAAAAAADAALSKTAAQNAATAAGNAQTAAEAAQSAVAEAVGDAEDAIDEAEAYRVSLGVLPGVFADDPVSPGYFVDVTFSSGYINNSGANKASTTNARSYAYYNLTEVKALSIPLPYKVKFVWFTELASSGYISHDAEYHNCGAGIVNYASPPANALYFRLQLAKQDGSTITAEDIEALNEAVVFYSTYKLQERQNALASAVDNVFSKELSLSNGLPTASFIKGKGINTSTGMVTDNDAAARSAMFYCVGDAEYAISYPDAYRARVFFYSAASFPTDESNTFLSSYNLRWQNNGHKMVYKTPPEALGVVFVLYPVDWHTLTDDDIAEIDASFRLCRPASALAFGPVNDVAESRERFIEYMDEMCAKLGMDDTTFVNASGLTADSEATAADELKMALAVAGNPTACDIWSTQSRDFVIGGSHARTISVTSNVFADWLTETTYRKLGGKGGSLEASSGGGKKRKAACVMHNISGIPVALALMGQGDFAYSNMEDCTRELCGMMVTKLAGGTPTEGTYLPQLVSAGGGYAAVPVPISANSYANTYDSAQILTRDNAVYRNADAVNIPASTTKTMTMLCALSVMPDLHEVIKVITGDITGGSGSTFYNGDKLTLIDALRIMMMESSNTLAECIGRIVGDRLLTIEAERG